MSEMNSQPNLLSGLRVIDCGTYIAGPAAATMMSDFGAEVIKIERPHGGDPYRNLSFLPGMPVSEHNYCWILDNRNKKSLAVDLRRHRSAQSASDLRANHWLRRSRCGYQQTWLRHHGLLGTIGFNRNNVRSDNRDRQIG